jgi:hypothetical protein
MNTPLRQYSNQLSFELGARISYKLWPQIGTSNKDVINQIWDQLWCIGLEAVETQLKNMLTVSF